MQATVIAPITPRRKCRDCSLIGFSPLLLRAGTAGALLWRRTFISGNLADARMTAIQSARKRIRGNFDMVIPLRGIRRALLVPCRTSGLREGASGDDDDFVDVSVWPKADMAALAADVRFRG